MSHQFLQRMQPDATYQHHYDQKPYTGHDMQDIDKCILECSAQELQGDVHLDFFLQHLILVEMWWRKNEPLCMQHISICLKNYVETKDHN